MEIKIKEQIDLERNLARVQNAIELISEIQIAHPIRDSALPPAREMLWKIKERIEAQLYREFYKGV